MLRIAIFDETKSRREDATRMISAYYKTKGYCTEIKQFKDAKAFTASFQTNIFSAVFIGMNCMRDVDVAWVIRDRDKECPLVIISHDGDYSLEGYRLDAAGYLLEPLNEQKVYLALDLIMRSKLQAHTKHILSG